ncbi:MAG TPA: glycosyltransferase [Candidatus Binatia bacterium]
MRIAQVITLFLPEFVGGATLVCADVARGLRDRGHTVEVFCGSPGADASTEGVRHWEIDGIPVTAVDAASGYVTLDTRSHRHPALTPHFESFLDRFAPDVVHLHSIQALGTTLIDAAAARAVPIVVTLHDWWWACARLFLVDADGFVCAPRVDSARCHCAPGFDLVARRRELDRALAHAAAVLTPSRRLAESAIANGVPRARVAVCPNGVAPTPRAAPRPGPVRFGYVGGPDNRAKGLPTLLAAVNRMGVGGWTLDLLGVAAGAAPVPLAVFDRVRHRPPFPPERRGAVFAALDCLVVPSLMRESYSMVAREALACGVPVIASDSGGPQEVLREGANGLTFATGDADDLARAMRALVREPELRERLRDGAAATPIPTLHAQLDQLEATYRTVTGRAEPRQVAAPALRRVLFITGIDGAPFRYRVTHLREQLRLHGIASAALYYSDPTIPAAIELADLVVVSRVPMSAWVARWMAVARAAARPLVFSCDDLVFDPAAAPHDALALLPEHHRAGWLAYGGRYAATLAACDAFLGSTQPLADAAVRVGIPGTVIRNGLGAPELVAAETARHDAAGAQRDVRIVYASGTTMHDLDFALVEHALATVLAAHPSARLTLVGYLRTGGALAPFARRIERLPFVPWPRLFRLLAAADICLAPLRADAFSDAKSEVKYLEAGAVGVPTVASPTWAFREAIRHGENGLLAATHDDWVRALDALVADGGLRRRLGNAARDDVFLQSGPEAQGDALVEALTAVLRRHAERPASPPLVPADATPDHAGRYDLEPGDAMPGSAETARDGASPVLAAERAVGQVFAADHDGLCRIDVCVASASGEMPALVVQVAADPAPTSPALRRVGVAAGPVAEDAWIAAEFAPIEGSAGRTFYAWVTLAPAEALEVPAVTLRTYTAGWGEGPASGLHLDHHPTPGSLAFRTFYRSHASESAAPLTPGSTASSR